MLFSTGYKRCKTVFRTEHSLQNFSLGFYPQILTSVRRPMSSVTSMRIASTAQARSNVDVDLATKATEAIVFVSSEKLGGNIR